MRIGFYSILFCSAIVCMDKDLADDLPLLTRPQKAKSPTSCCSKRAIILKAILTALAICGTIGDAGSFYLDATSEPNAATTEAFAPGANFTQNPKCTYTHHPSHGPINYENICGNISNPRSCSWFLENFQSVVTETCPLDPPNNPIFLTSGVAFLTRFITLMVVFCMR